ncbi:hypothetical protein PMI16_04835 [Herbaspirillum sp. CF444]|uniref:hypothetical protein n=1 Tax=Herbaspirillum sp. CF444 TaxID=1144319 RepID=UPI000272469F|nr:hypothetical protein [Herbaspirillum sp. CF444]EJL81229.1 hypothetical protein PMI16_04835 [Herbaspirillum sp. CF444]
MRNLPSIEVFQDLSLTAVDGDGIALRKALINEAKGLWHHDLEMESRAIGLGTGSENTLLALRRDGDELIPAAVVTLFPEGDGGYKVTNVVPSELYALTHHQYNSVLKDFIECVAKPTAPAIEIRLSKGTKSLMDWTSAEAASALGIFSRAANKSTGSSHPADRDRWMAFIVQHHQSRRNDLDPSVLARWLSEADGWPEDMAHELAIEFESALDLLAYYDGHR